MSFASETTKIFEFVQRLSRDHRVRSRNRFFVREGAKRPFLVCREEGFFSLSKGWAPTLIGYSFQGFGKFGFYEIFKVFYSSLLNEEDAFDYRTLIYLFASASAELLADISLAPWEAPKVRIQTQDNWASSLRRGLPKLYGKSSKAFVRPVKMFFTLDF